MSAPVSRRRFLAAGGALALAACAELPRLGAQRDSGFAAVNGTRLYYETAGTGEPVVLLHGFTFDRRMWDDQFQLLAQKYRVIRYDARGFGKSDVPQPGIAYAQHEDLAALIAQLGAPNPHLVGLSMGGRFALDFAVSYPGKCRSVIVIDTVIGGYGVVQGWPWSRQFMGPYEAVIAAGRRKDIAAAKAAWLAHPLFAPMRSQPAVAARVEQMVNDYSGWHFVNPDPARQVVPPTITQLSRIDVRTLALVGERDLVDFQRMSEEVARAVPQAKRVVIPGVGNIANMEAPEPVNAALLGFLAASG